MTTMTQSLDPQQIAAVDELRAQIARMNDAVKRAVDSGLTIEITRASRHHSPQYCWGDQMSPKILTANN